MVTTFNPAMAQASAEAETTKAVQAFAEAQQKNQEAVIASRDLKTDKFRKFKNSYLSCNYIFKDGTQAVFKLGAYLTDNPHRIAELEEEVKRGHPHISIDKDDYEVSEEDLNPEAVLRKRHFAEFQKEMEANANRDMGTSEQGKLKPANTKDMAANISNGASSLGAVPVALLNALNTQSGSGTVPG